MKYKVLYRKYRPDDFDTIIGQNYIITTLRNSIKNNAVSHAYLFSGPRGTGKTTTAKVLAKAVNCLNPKDGSPCGECEFCHNFKENPDIIEMDAASNRGVNEIKTIIDNVKLTPTNGKYKVYIIDEVHMLTKEAFNALLLTLEEPPAHTIFILATTNVENVPITILSRCQRFDFQKINKDDIVMALKNICQKENIIASDEALNEIAYLSEGGMRDALSLLDQLSKNNQEINLELIESEIKTVSKKTIDELINYLEKNDIDNLIKLIADLKQRSVDYITLVKKIIDVASQKAIEIKKTNHIYNLTFNDYKQLIFQLSESLNKININVDNFVILEMILLSFIKKDSIIENNSNKNIKEKNTSVDTVIETNETSIDEKIITTRINNCFVSAQKQNLEESQRQLQTILDDEESNGPIKSILLDSKIVAASETNLILTCRNDHNVVKANKILKDIESIFYKKFAVNYKVIYLTNKRWQEEKENYIINLKNKKKYKYINEEEEEKINEDDIEISDVFDKSKVEVI